MKELTLIFDIEHGGEIGAGILPYTDVVKIIVESGDPGGERGEFRGFMDGTLSEWFDGAEVSFRTSFAVCVGPHLNDKSD